MSAPERIDGGDPAAASTREHFERLGYARAEVDGAEKALAAQRQKRQELSRQNEVVETECKQLERELLQKLAFWRKLDEHTQTVDTLLPQFRAVTGSFTYRAAAALLRTINRLRRAISFGWLRRG